MCLRAIFLRQIFLRGFHTKTIAEFTLTCYHSHTSARKSAPQKHCIRPSSPQIREYIVTNIPHCAFLRMHHAGCFYILEDICRAGAATPFPQGVPLHFTESKDNQLKRKNHAEPVRCLYAFPHSEAHSCLDEVCNTGYIMRISSTFSDGFVRTDAARYMTLRNRFYV